MSEEQETGGQAKEEPVQERVGDILRRERINRRIAFETIAKDLKLNVRYVRSLEANDYNALPADPYIRVYLRSLSKYLSLDPEAILKKFYDERGIHDENYRKGSDTQIVITMAKTPGKKEVKPWMIIVGVIVVLGVISFFANRKAIAPAHPPAVATRADSAKAAQRTAPTDSAEDSLIGKMVRRDTIAAAPVAAPAPISLAGDTSAAAATALDSISTGGGILSLEIKAKKDSVWLQIFSDGVSWKNWLKGDQIKRCVARDSFNVCIGNNSLLSYTFNGKTLRIEAKDVVIFKIARGMKKPEFWTLAKWNSVFKGRT